MSAYFVTKETIDLLISFAIENDIYAIPEGSNSSCPVKVTKHNANEFGRMLLRENIKSLEYSYTGEMDNYFPGCKEEAENYIFTKYEEVLPFGALGCVNNLKYQSCEHPSWKSSNAREFLVSVVSKVAELLAVKSAPWGVDKDTIERYATVARPIKRRGRPFGSKNKPKS